jgi:hypothetical protein
MAECESAAHHSVASCRRKEPRGSGGSLEEGEGKLEVTRFYEHGREKRAWLHFAARAAFSL